MSSSEMNITDKEKYLKLFEAEKKLQQLKENPRENGKEINRVMLSLRKDYLSFILENPVTAAAKDIHTALWKTCFYKQIDEYRRSLKKTKGIIDQKSNPEQHEKASVHLMHLIAAFSKFLSDSIAWYQEFLLQIEAEAIKLVKAKKTTLTLQYCQSLSRCLLYLGDLARYRTLHSEDDNNDYSESAKYYERSSFIFPQSGHPVNQLALIAGYKENPFDALFYHFRSILCEQPFPSGIENLMNLFEKNVHTDQELSEITQNLLYNVNKSFDRNKSNVNELRRRETDVYVKIFQLKVINILFMLFDWEQKAKQLISTYKKFQTDDNLELFDFNLIENMVSTNNDLIARFELALQEVLKNLEELVLAHSLPESVLVRMICVCIFSFYHQTKLNVFDEFAMSEVISDIDSSNNKIEDHASKQIRTIGESLALSMLFGIIIKMSTTLIRITNTVDRVRKAQGQRLISSLSIFSEWLSHNISCMFPTDTFTSQKPILLCILSYGDLNQSHNRVSSNMRSTVMMIEDYVDEMMGKYENQNSDFDVSADGVNKLLQLPLKEHLELRGCVYIKDYLEALFKRFNPFGKFPPSFLPEDVSKYRRLRAIKQLIQDHLIPYTRSANAIAANTSSSSSSAVKLTNDHIDQEKASKLFPVDSYRDRERHRNKTERKSRQERDRERDLKRSSDNDVVNNYSSHRNTESGSQLGPKRQSQEVKDHNFNARDKKSSESDLKTPKVEEITLLSDDNDAFPPLPSASVNKVKVSSSAADSAYSYSTATSAFTSLMSEDSHGNQIDIYERSSDCQETEIKYDGDSKFENGIALDAGAGSDLKFLYTQQSFDNFSSLLAISSDYNSTSITPIFQVDDNGFSAQVCSSHFTNNALSSNAIIDDDGFGDDDVVLFQPSFKLPVSQATNFTNNSAADNSVEASLILESVERWDFAQNQTWLSPGSDSLSLNEQLITTSISDASASLLWSDYDYLNLTADENARVNHQLRVNVQDQSRQSPNYSDANRYSPNQSRYHLGEDNNQNFTTNGITASDNVSNSVDSEISWLHTHLSASDFTGLTNPENKLEDLSTYRNMSSTLNITTILPPPGLSRSVGVGVRSNISSSTLSRSDTMSPPPGFDNTIK